MRRLTAKPRRKQKSIILTFRYSLDIHEDDPDEAKKIGTLFKTWMRDKFSNWDDTILQHFLYENNIIQNSNDDRVVLEGHLEKIVKDDCATYLEKQEFDDDLNAELDSYAGEDYELKDTSSSESIHKDNSEIPTVGEPGFKEYKKRS